MKVEEQSDEFGGLDIVLHFGDAEGQLLEHTRVLLAALQIHEQRREEYGDNWRRQGYRGSLFKLRLKVERVWDGLWGQITNREIDTSQGNMQPTIDQKTDDLLDAINYAAMAWRLARVGDRDGEWRYPS